MYSRKTESNRGAKLRRKIEERIGQVREFVGSADAQRHVIDEVRIEGQRREDGNDCECESRGCVS